MKAPSFLAHRMELELKLHGVGYTFERSGIDKFGQPTNDDKQQIVVKGIYHESNSYIQKKSTDATVVRTKKNPMIMCMYQDGCNIQQDDEVTINDKQYKVTGVLDIQNYSVVADISLEEVI